MMFWIMETRSSYGIKIRITDDALPPLSAYGNVRIDVLDANDPPLFGTSLPPSAPAPPKRLGCYRQNRYSTWGVGLRSDGSTRRYMYYRDTKDFKYVGKAVGATVGECETHCHSLGFKYFALQWWENVFAATLTVDSVKNTTEMDASIQQMKTILVGLIKT